MTWFKVDDSFYDHPKVFDAPDCAVALWTRAGTWSARNLTDGFVPTGMPARFCNDPDQAVRELVSRGLWKRARGGYQFHDWGSYQPSRDDVEADREAARERMRKLRAQRRSAGQKADSSGEQQPNVRANFGRSSQPPTRPDQSKNKTSSSTATPSSDRPPKAGSDDDPAFVRFWAAYPRRIGKGQARKAWATAVKKADPELIIKAAGDFTTSRGHEDPKFTPHPSTWLNGERWNDSPDPAPTATPGPVMPWELWD